MVTVHVRMLNVKTVTVNCFERFVRLFAENNGRVSEMDFRRALEKELHIEPLSDTPSSCHRLQGLG